MTVQELGNVLNSLPINPHYQYVPTGTDYPYLVYWEYYRHFLRAENKNIDYYDLAQISYFTKRRGDKTVYAICDLLNENEIPFDYQIIYEQSTKVFHHVFDCSLI